jgi:hypothetical protein
MPFSQRIFMTNKPILLMLHPQLTVILSKGYSLVYLLNEQLSPVPVFLLKTGVGLVHSYTVLIGNGTIGSSFLVGSFGFPTCLVGLSCLSCL